MEKEWKKWSEDENDVLLRYVEAYPHNLHKCFIMVSEHLTDAGSPRTAGAVQAHWYSVLSKRTNHVCFFTATKRTVDKNRKNSMGTEINNSIWRRFLRIIRSI